MKVAAIFAGIGGIELGLHQAGHNTQLLCEIDPAAQAVLRAQFPNIPVVADVTTLDLLPAGVDLITAGFPCQDLSQAGRTAGIAGSRSGLVSHVFRLLDQTRTPWLLIENVSFMLQLDRGAAMTYLVSELENRGYRWAYRVVDSRAFGLPQRRKRVYLLASRQDAPEEFLFADDAGPPAEKSHHGVACGFYWTEGNRGLGWAVDAIPTIKGGSSLGIPSAPAIWFPDGRIATPDIVDAERLQGFPANWTKPALQVARPGYRWKLVGNSVTVRAAKWIGTLLNGQQRELHQHRHDLNRARAWPSAAYGDRNGRFLVEASEWPFNKAAPSLERFLTRRPHPLSFKATRGFASRLRASTLKYPPEFLVALDAHLRSLESEHAGSTEGS